MGNQIGPYNILKELGKGGTSNCYLAVKPPLEREILLKVLYPQFAIDAEILTRFEREARIMSRLRHPNIVQILDFGKLENTYFITMEFIEGKLLEEIIICDKIAPEEATRIIIGVLNALSYVHTRGIIHRDIKPSNILIANDGTPKLTDFGLALSKSLPGITADGTFLGTPAYMSLEQLKGEKVDQRSDIYSLGLIFLELLTGVKAYSGATYGEVIQNILTKSPQEVDKLKSHFSPILASVVSKMIAKEYESRYHSADEVMYEFKQLKEVQPQEVQPQGEPVRKRKLFNVSSSLRWFIVVLFLVFVGWNMKRIYRLRPASEVRSQQSEIGHQESEFGSQKSGIGKQESEVREQKSEVRSEKQEFSPQQPVSSTWYSVYISVLPYAKVYLNDTLIGETPPSLQAKVKFGTYTLTLENPQFPRLATQINVNSAKEININLLEEFSYLWVFVKPWAEIRVDGTYYGATPLASPLTLLPGEHEVKLHNPYYDDYVERINLGKEDTLEFKFEFKK